MVIPLSGVDVLIICAGILATLAITSFVLTLLFDDKNKKDE